MFSRSYGTAPLRPRPNLPTALASLIAVYDRGLITGDELAEAVDALCVEHADTIDRAYVQCAAAGRWPL
jgi:hypothetical protein